MTTLERLSACAGPWRGTNILQDPGTGWPEETASNATVTPILGGRFIRIDYAWGHQDRPQEGSLLIRVNGGDLVSAYWIDSWHMDTKVMTCTGRMNTRKLSIHGSYSAPPGPDWGWRIDVASEPEELLQMWMFNISPEGGEELAMESKYTPL